MSFFYTFHFDFGLSKKDLRLAAVFLIIIIIFQIECEMNLGAFAAESRLLFVR